MTHAELGMLSACAAAGVLGYLLIRLLRWRGALHIGLLSSSLMLLGWLAYDDYQWYPKTLATLPPGSLVLATGTQVDPSHPWSYLKPAISSFILAGESDSLEHNGDILLLVQETRHQRKQQQATTSEYLLNCTSADRVVRTAQSIRIEPGSQDDHVYTSLCRPYLATDETH